MAGTRRAVQDGLYTALAAATSLASLTGATASDKRVYQAYGPVEHTLTTTMPGFVTIDPITEGEPSKARETHTYQIAAHAIQHSRCKDICDAIDAQIHRKRLTITGWTQVVTKRVATRSAWQDAAGAWNQAMDYEVQVS